MNPPVETPLAVWVWNVRVLLPSVEAAQSARSRPIANCEGALGRLQRRVFRETECLEILNRKAIRSPLRRRELGYLRPFVPKPQSGRSNTHQAPACRLSKRLYLL